MPNRYNAEIVAGALLPIESRILAELYLNRVPEKELKHLLTVENVLQKRSPATAVRVNELVKKRFAQVDSSLLEIIARENRQISTQALLVAAVKHNKLIGDFLLRVVADKWRMFETKLCSGDWENFLAECAQIDRSVNDWKETTRRKLRQVVYKCLTEAGYLENARQPVITPILLYPQIKQYLFEHREDYVLSCLTIFN